MLYKKQSISSLLDFSNFPEVFYANEPAALNISVNGYGLIKGTSGLRWWDSNTVTDNGSIILTTGQTLTLPFTRAYLNSGFLLDLFAEVKLNGIPYWYAASNSTDNAVTSSAAVERKLFHLPLYCFGIANSGGSSSASNHFMQGGSSNVNLSGAQVAVYFLEPTTSSGTLTITASFVGYSSSFSNVFTKTVNYSAGVSSVNVFAVNEMTNGIDSGVPYNSGYYKIGISCSDPTYSSMLNFYHWGQSA